MTRLSKIPAKVAFLFCTLFCLYSPVVLSQQVDTAWVRRYNGPGNGDDQAVALAVDSSGNVYVTGSSFDSTTGYDYATIKYLPNGDTGWVRRFTSPMRKDDFATALELDSSGNVYVTGRSNGDFATIKYDSAGNELWVQRIVDIVGVAGHGAYALDLDGSGNVYVTGSTWDGEAGEFMFTVKYDSLGNYLWARNYFLGRRAIAIAVDTGGNAYVTGWGLGPNLADYLTIRYYPNGDTAWVRRYNGPANGDDFANDIAVGSSGDVYVAGSSSSDLVSDFAVIKYDSLGNQLWVRRSNGISDFSEYGATLVATDKFENVYVSGYSFYFPDLINWLTIKFDSAGNQFWVREWNGIDIGAPRALHAMALDTGGNIYITGYDAWYAATLKYDPDGNLIWEKKYDDSDLPLMNAVAINQKGDVYVAGLTQHDFLTIKYSPLPQLKGDLNLDGILDLNDVVFALNCTFLGEPPPAAPAACDINCDGKVTAADVVILLNMVFLSATAPC